MKKEDSQNYKARKKFFDALITLYGRNSVLEALQEEQIEVLTLHLATSNQESREIQSMREMAQKRHVEIKMHDKKSLSRISKNAKQDQGVALDIKTAHYKAFEDFSLPKHGKFIALDGIHNPQNLGMIIRSIAASGIDALILPKDNSAKLSPLVMKASAGTLFKAPILFCQSLDTIMEAFIQADYDRYMLSSHAKENVLEMPLGERTLFVLGNESEGVSPKVEALCNQKCKIPMHNGVESLNVAVTAALVAFRA